MTSVRFSFGLGFALAMGVAANAQDGMPAAGSASATTPVVPPAGAQIEFSNAASMSPADQLKGGERVVAHVGKELNSIAERAKQAKDQRDPVKIVCLEDKKSQLTTTQESATERFASLKGDVERHDNEAATHDYKILLVLDNRVDSLAAEANACVGDEVAYAGEGAVTTTVDQNIADNTAATGYVDDTSMWTPPQCVSCSL